MSFKKLGALNVNVDYGSGGGYSGSDPLCEAQWNHILYTVPDDCDTIVSQLLVVNRNSDKNVTVRVAHISDGRDYPIDSDYLLYDQIVCSNTSFPFKRITMAAGDHISIYSDYPGVNFILHGDERVFIAGYSGAPAANQVPVSLYGQKGVMLVSTAPSTPAAFPYPGAIGYVLVSDPSTSTGLYWTDTIDCGTW